MSFSDEDDEGFHFDPTDEEVIKFYLIPKLENTLRESENFIVTKDVYSVEPWLLEHHNDPIFMENQWYYFVRRTQVSNKKTGCGKNTKRRIVGNSGSWHASKKQDIIDEVTGNIIGTKQTLKFVENSNKRQKTGNASDDHDDDVPGVSEGSWIMKEFALPEGEKFHELVVCRIEKKITKKENHEIVNRFNFIGSASTSTLSDQIHGDSSKEHQPIDQCESERCENSEAPLNTPLSQEPPTDSEDINWNILLDPDVNF